MMRLVFLVTLLLAYCYAHHGGDHEEGHHHESAVDISLANGQLSVLFHAPEGEDFEAVKFNINDGTYTGTQQDGEEHGDHINWSYVFTVSGIDVCDDVHVKLTGVTTDGDEHPEFNGMLTIPDPDGC